MSGNWEYRGDGRERGEGRNVVVGVDVDATHACVNAA